MFFKKTFLLSARKSAKVDKRDDVSTWGFHTFKSLASVKSDKSEFDLKMLSKT